MNSQNLREKTSSTNLEARQSDSVCQKIELPLKKLIIPTRRNYSYLYSTDKAIYLVKEESKEVVSNGWGGMLSRFEDKILVKTGILEICNINDDLNSFECAMVPKSGGMFVWSYALDSNNGRIAFWDKGILLNPEKARVEPYIYSHDLIVQSLDSLEQKVVGKVTVEVVADCDPGMGFKPYRELGYFMLDKLNGVWVDDWFMFNGHCQKNFLRAFNTKTGVQKILADEIAHATVKSKGPEGTMISAYGNTLYQTGLNDLDKTQIIYKAPGGITDIAYDENKKEYYIMYYTDSDKTVASPVSYVSDRNLPIFHLIKISNNDFNKPEEIFENYAWYGGNLSYSDSNIFFSLTEPVESYAPYDLGENEIFGGNPENEFDECIKRILIGYIIDKETSEVVEQVVGATNVIDFGDISDR